MQTRDSHGRFAAAASVPQTTPRQAQEKRSPLYASGGYYLVERTGQEDVETGDRVRVIATICLPCSGETEKLRGDLRFGWRLEVGNSALFSDWGFKSQDSFVRHRRLSFYASTWAAAFASAEEWAHTELQRLDDAIAARAQALADAE